MAKEKLTTEQLQNGIRTVSLTLDVLKFIIEEKEREKDWLQKQVKILKLKDDD